MSVLSIGGLLDDEQLARIRGELGALTWRDGKITAGGQARRVKQNEQADLSTPDGRKLRTELKEAILAHPVVRSAARPRRMSPLMISRTADGGHYGAHIDNAIMGKGEERLRTDLSFTLFLAPPETYEGGELVLHTSSGTQRLKSDVGDLVLYPSSEIHEVTPVTSGTRIACVGWIESLVPDQAKRALLFDLENLRVSLRRSMPTGCAELLTLDKSIANLLRMWAQP